jgi:hypothetical protein
MSKWTFLPTFDELQAHTDEQLRERYDEATQARQPAQATFALDELRRRESKHSEDTMRPVESWGASPRLSPSGWPNLPPRPGAPCSHWR